jgi:hypothetical protein
MIELGAVWVRVEPVLRRSLRRQGVAADDVDDITQEVFTRALERGVVFSDINDCYRWCRIVGTRLATDQWRMSQRHRDRRRVPGRVEPEDAAERARHRVALEQTLAALPALMPAELAAVRVAVGGPKGLSTAQRVSLHRARLRLRALVRETLGAVPWWRRVVWRWRQLMVPLFDGSTVAAAVTASIAGAVLLLPPVASPEAASHKPRPVMQTERHHTTPPQVATLPAAHPELRNLLATGRRSERPVPPSSSPARLDLTADRQVGLPGPTGTQAGTRQNDGAKPLLCLWTPAIGKVCSPPLS